MSSDDSNYFGVLEAELGDFGSFCEELPEVLYLMSPGLEFDNPKKGDFLVQAYVVPKHMCELEKEQISIIKLMTQFDMDIADKFGYNFVKSEWFGAEKILKENGSNISPTFVNKIFEHFDITPQFADDYSISLAIYEYVIDSEGNGFWYKNSIQKKNDLLN